MIKSINYRNKGINASTVILVFLALLFSALIVITGAGKTEAAGPVTIMTAEDLDSIRADMTGDYVLGADINLDVAPYNAGAGWEPIGYFEGTFDGKGHTISGLMIDKSINQAGLFGGVSGKSTISNVNLVNVDITAGHRVGGLVGEIGNGGLIENVTVTGKVSGADMVGGIAGNMSNAKIKNSHAVNITVVGRNDARAGGLIGTAGGDGAAIEGSTSSGTVTAGGSSVGGLAAGANYVKDSSSSAKVTATRASDHNAVGGLIGRVHPFSGEITNSFATGDVESISTNVGGLIGHLSINGTSIVVSNSYATGTVTGTDRVGGLVGNFNSPLNNLGTVMIKDSYATGEVFGANSVGGLIGLQNGEKGTIQKSYSESSVRGTGNDVGGLVGHMSNQTKIVDAYARGIVMGANNVGGLVGNNSASTIQRAYATGKVTGGNEVGGLVGKDLRGVYSPQAPNYYDKETTTMTDTVGATGDTTVNMQTRLTFEGWNFTSTWKLNPNDYPIFRDEPFEALTDVPSGHWGRDYITEIYETGIMSGSPDPNNPGKFIFEPSVEINRAQFAIVIVNALDEGKNATSTNTGFNDDSSIPSWAKKEVAKAKELGIIKGDDNGRFNPNDKIRRSEIAAMIARAYKLEATDGGSLDFVDADSIQDWAVEGIQAVVESGIMQGEPGNRFAPNANADRVQAGVSALRAYQLD